MGYALLLAAVALLSGQPSPEAAMKARVERAPRDVSGFIERRAGCNHWSGEEPYDHERAVQIGAALRELRCAGISKDEAKLRAKYRWQPKVLKLLAETADILGW